MIDLKIKCTICTKEETNKEAIKEVSTIIEKYNLKAEHYLHLLNVMSEKCMDSDEHSFIFDGEFLKQTTELVTKYKSDIAEIDKLKIVNEGLSKEQKELEIKLKELSSKIQSNKDRMNNLYSSTYRYEDEIEGATGYRNLVIWY